MFKNPKNSNKLIVDPPDGIHFFADTVYKQAINRKTFETHVESAIVPVKPNQPQLLPNHVFQKKRHNHSIDGVKVTSLSDNSFCLSMNSDNCQPVS